MIARRRVILSDQLPEQPEAQILQVMQEVAQIGIGLALQLGPRVILNALDRRLCGESGTDRLAQPP